MELNLNISPFRCYVRRGWFTKKEDWEVDTCTAFGIQSTPGKCLSFILSTDYGMIRSRVPINEIFLSESAVSKENYRQAHMVQLWDCFGYHASIIEYDYLCEKRIQILLKDRSKVWGTYMMTVDWHSNPYSDTGHDYKCAHIICGDSGNLFAMPNNRLLLHDMNFITKDFPVPPSEIKVDNEPLVSVESFSDRWVSEDTDCYYYDIKQNPPTLMGKPGE